MRPARVFVIGSSLNMIAFRSATTVFTPVPEDGLDVFTKLLEDQWSAGEPLRPAMVKQEDALDGEG